MFNWDFKVFTGSVLKVNGFTFKGSKFTSFILLPLSKGVSSLKKDFAALRANSIRLDHLGRFFCTGKQAVSHKNCYSL